MTHMVIFRSAEGKPGYHQADSLEDAVRFVERLRNSESVTDSRIFHMQEVPIEFRQYFRVEVSSGASSATPSGGFAEPAAEPAPIVEGEAVVSDLEEPTADLDAPEPVGAANGNGNGRFGLFSHR